MSRAAEIAQGLRDEGGALTFALDAFEYVQGISDYEDGSPPPRMTSASYDLGRARAAEKAARIADVAERLALEAAERRRRMREVLADHPEALAEYEAKMAGLSKEGR